MTPRIYNPYPGYAGFPQWWTAVVAGAGVEVAVGEVAVAEAAVGDMVRRTAP